MPKRSQIPRCALIPLEPFRKAMAEDHQLCLQMMTGLTFWVRHLLSLMEDIVLRDAAGRMARFLLESTPDRGRHRAAADAQAARRQPLEFDQRDVLPHARPADRRGTGHRIGQQPGPVEWMPTACGLWRTGFTRRSEAREDLLPIIAQVR